MKESGKFPTNKSRKKEKSYDNIKSFKCLEKYKNLNDEEYKASYTSHNDYIMEEMAKENGFDK